MFNKMKIWMRFVLSFSLSIAFIIVIILVSINQIKVSHDKLTRIIKINNVRIAKANEMMDDTRQVSIELRESLLNSQTEKRKNVKDNIERLRIDYDACFDKIIELTPAEDTKGQDLIASVRQSCVASRELNNKVLDLNLNNKDLDALKLMEEKARPSEAIWMDNIDKLIKYNEEYNAERYSQAEIAQATAVTTMTILGLAAVLISILIAFLLTLSITKPMKVATNLILSRDLSMDLSAYEKGENEFGVMIRAFRKNITEQLTLEKDMHASSIYARNLIEASLDPLVTINADGKITDVNQTTVKATGVSKVQLIGSDFADYFTEPDKARIGYKKVFSEGIVKDYPLSLRNSNGQTIDVLYNASIYRNEEGEVQGVFAAARDITDSKRQEKELIIYRDQLEDLVKQRTNDLSKVLDEVKETINILVSSSSEILAATTQVATGTAETATAISETSATVEEVQQASKQSSQKAKNVADSAQRVVQVFQNGQRAVEETINGMNKIREQMDSISQTVVRLSEQSQSIGGIIASVTDIADQSNLLAVNAAIEAAKAGEQGKGFAVVAQEIKNLAGQSKQATLQVRNILNDIQKVTGAAVMATEQGSKAVETGLKQSQQAGETIRILAESSNEAVQAATQIVASSQQQVIGMDQIGVAMQNINQAGTETAVSMVQAEKSAKSLYELGQKLKVMIDKFKG